MYICVGEPRLFFVLRAHKVPNIWWCWWRFVQIFSNLMVPVCRICVWECVHMCVQFNGVSYDSHMGCDSIIFWASFFYLQSLNGLHLTLRMAL